MQLIIVFALASCATYVANPPYSPDSQLQGRSFEVVGEIKPLTVNDLMTGALGSLRNLGLKNLILEKAKKELGNVDDVINIRSVTVPDKGYTVYEATAIRYTD